MNSFGLLPIQKNAFSGSEEVRVKGKKVEKKKRRERVPSSPFKLLLARHEAS